MAKLFINFVFLYKKRFLLHKLKYTSMNGALNMLKKRTMEKSVTIFTGKTQMTKINEKAIKIIRAIRGRLG